MDKERAEEILKDNNMTKVAFAESVGLKIGTVRNAFRKKAFSALIRFDDGVRGKFRCKPDKFLKLGEEVSVKHIDGEMWELVK